MPFSDIAGLSSDCLIRAAESAIRKKIPAESNKRLARLALSNFEFTTGTL